jgi:hypothetical protein
MNSLDFQQVLNDSNEKLKTENLPKWLDQITEKKQRILIFTTFLLFIDTKDNEKDKEKELLKFNDYYAFIKKTDFKNLDTFEFIKNVENLNVIGSLQVYIRFAANDLLFVFNKDCSSSNINFIDLNDHPQEQDKNNNRSEDNNREIEKEKEMKMKTEKEEDLDKFFKIENIEKFKKKNNFACAKSKEIVKYFIRYKKSIIFNLSIKLTKEEGEEDCLSLILSELKDIIPLDLISKILKKFKKSIKNILINPSTSQIIFKILNFKKINFSEKRKLINTITNANGNENGTIDKTESNNQKGTGTNNGGEREGEGEREKKKKRIE